MTPVVTEFADRRLGKGVVPCKDTPNFIANRIGSFFGGTVQKITVEGGYTVEEVDLSGGLCECAPVAEDGDGADCGL